MTVANSEDQLVCAIQDVNLRALDKTLFLLLHPKGRYDQRALYMHTIADRALAAIKEVKRVLWV